MISSDFEAQVSADRSMTSVAKERCYKEGLIGFDAFSSLALQSAIPSEYLPALSNQLLAIQSSPSVRAQTDPQSVYLKMAQVLLGKEFDGFLDARYAVVFSQAVATVKAWDQTHMENTRNQTFIAEGLHCTPEEIPEILKVFGADFGGLAETVISQIENLTSTENLLKNEAITAFGLSKQVIAEWKTRENNIFLRFTDLMSGQSIDHKLKGIREYLESYFSQPSSKTRMILLGQPPRK